jgi:radical SAM superfamily enzyme YgiQ (UPF0313 family)
MKIVLFTPDFPCVQQTRRSHESLGLLYLATLVQDIHEVHVVNAVLDGLDEDEVVKNIAKINPDLVGVSINFAPTLASGVSIVKKLRQSGFDGFVVAGGNTATFLCRELLSHGFADIVVLNEGEVTFTELARVLRNRRADDLYDELMKIKGIAFRERKGGVYVTEKRGFINDLDRLPYPNRDYHREFYRSSDTAVIITSRGCPFDCFYCSTNQMWGRKWRARSPENIISEMKQVRNRYPTIDCFDFIDDNFLVSRHRIEKMANMLRAEELDIKFGFSTRVEHVDKKLLDILSGAGAKGMFVGVESGSTRVLQLMNRRYTPAEVIDKVAYAESLGIRVTASFMIGLPFESEQDIEGTFKLLREIPASKTQCHIFTPLVGTPCYDKPQEFGIVLYESNPGNITLDQEAYIDTRYFSRSRIGSFHRKAISIILQKEFLNNMRQKRKVLRCNVKSQ